MAGLHRLLRPAQRLQGVGVLLLAGETVALRAVLGEGTHQPAALVGVFQAVEEHMVEHLAVAHAIASAGAR